MKKAEVIKYVLIGTVCLLAIFGELGLFEYDGIAMYMAFAACSFIVCDKRANVYNIIKILIVTFGVIVARFLILWVSAVGFLHSFVSFYLYAFIVLIVYFAAFVLVNSWINKRSNVLSKKVYMVSGLLILMRVIFEGTYAIMFNKLMDGAVAQSSLISWLLVFDNNFLLRAVGILLFYANLYYISIQFAKNH